jgi:hypothetical protein
LLILRNILEFARCSNFRSCKFIFITPRFLSYKIERIELSERGRVVRRSRRAHNPEIGGSNPSPAIGRDMNINADLPTVGFPLLVLPLFTLRKGPESRKRPEQGFGEV